MNKITTRILPVILMMLITAEGTNASDLTGLSPLTDRIVMLRFDDGYFKHYGYGQSTHGEHHIGQLAARRRCRRRPGDRTGSRARTMTITEKPEPPEKVGRKSKPKDASQSNQVIKEHFIYLRLPFPLKAGKNLHGDDGRTLAANMNEFTFVFDAKRIRSESIHASQVGYVTDGPKFAYVSHWMGDMGPLDLDGYADVRFSVIRTSDSIPAFSGTLVKRRDLETASSSDGPDVGKKPMPMPMSGNATFRALSSGRGIHHGD